MRMAPDASADPARAEALKAIKRIVGAKGWSDDPSVLDPLLIDCRGQFFGEAALLVRPASTEEVSKVLEACAAAGISVVPQGGNTSMCGGATPFAKDEAILLGLGRMNRIREIDALNSTITVEEPGRASCRERVGPYV